MILPSMQKVVSSRFCYSILQVFLRSLQLLFFDLAHLERLASIFKACHSFLLSHFISNKIKIGLFSVSNKVTLVERHKCNWIKLVSVLTAVPVAEMKNTRLPTDAIRLQCQSKPDFKLRVSFSHHNENAKFFIFISLKSLWGRDAPIGFL